MRMREALRNARLSKGISQSFIAKKLGYKNASGYANIEYGMIKPSLKNAVVIAETLEQDIKEIFDDIFFEDKLHETCKYTS